MDARSFEFKIQEGRGWKDTDIAVVLHLSIRSSAPRVSVFAIADQFALTLANIHDAEVRWNLSGCSQGHYIGGYA